MTQFKRKDKETTTAVVEETNHKPLPIPIELEKPVTYAIACCDLLQEHIDDEEKELELPQVEFCCQVIEKRSKKDFFFFSKYILGFDLFTEETHKVWADNLQLSLENRIAKMMRLKPRGTFKTTLYGVAFVLWLWACISPELRIFYTSSNALLLEEVSDKLSAFLNPKNESLFQLVFGVKRDDEGKLAPKNTGDVFNIVGRSGKGFSLILRTAGGGTAGIHPNVIIVDDPCFVGETPVLTKTGYKPIKDIEVGEFVLTRKGYKEVTWSGRTGKKKRVETYIINGRLLTLTNSHKIITENRGKVPVKKIKDTDTLYVYKNKLWKIEAAEANKTGLGGKADVYNITVKDEHEYIANGVLVANCDKNDRESLTVRNKKEHWFDSLTPLLVPFVPRDGSLPIKFLLFIATRWHMNDLMHYIFELNKKTNDWDIEIEGIFNEEGTSNYPEFISNEDIEKIKSSISTTFFACQYLNDPMPEGLRLFSEPCLHFVEYGDLDMMNGQKACFFDPSEGEERSDWPAVIWTVFKDNKLTVFAALNEKMPLAELMHFIAYQNKVFGVTVMIMEKTSVSLVKENLGDAHAAIGHSIEIIPINNPGNKIERITFIQPDLYSGFCSFLKDWEERYPVLRDQLLFFPVHTYDDYPDAIQMAVSHYRQEQFVFTRYTRCS